MALLKKLMVLGVLLSFLSMGIARSCFAQSLYLPAPSSMIGLSSKFTPLAVEGIHFYPQNPFLFDFIVDTGDSHLSREQLKIQGQKLAAYFLASLTTPEKDLWVNLSPYEKDRIVAAEFGRTQMGKALLAEDYVLKQMMATALYPERQLGKEFWQRVYIQAARQYGTAQIPIRAFNRVWIVPDKAAVYANGRLNSVFVVQSSLKVMLEADYLALKKNNNRDTPQERSTSTIMREIILPALNKEINEGKNFAPLRQVYKSLILADWYKKNLKDGILGKGYVDKDKISGVQSKDPAIEQKIYDLYLQAYRKGVYNYVKEEIDPLSGRRFARKYFSGGVKFGPLDLAMASAAQAQVRLAHFDMRARAHKLVLLTVAALAVGGVLSSAEAAAPQLTQKFQKTDGVMVHSMTNRGIGDTIQRMLTDLGSAHGYKDYISLRNRHLVFILKANGEVTEVTAGNENSFRNGTVVIDLHTLVSSPLPSSPAVRFTNAINAYHDPGVPLQIKQKAAASFNQAQHLDRILERGRFENGIRLSATQKSDVRRQEQEQLNRFFAIINGSAAAPVAGSAPAPAPSWGLTPHLNRPHRAVSGPPLPSSQASSGSAGPPPERHGSPPMPFIPLGGDQKGLIAPYKFRSLGIEGPDFQRLMVLLSKRGYVTEDQLHQYHVAPGWYKIDRAWFFGTFAYRELTLEAIENILLAIRGGIDRAQSSYGGIDLAAVPENAIGAGIKVDFTAAEAVQMLAHSQGLFPKVEAVAPMTPATVQAFFTFPHI